MAGRTERRSKGHEAHEAHEAYSTRPTSAKPMSERRRRLTSRRGQALQSEARGYVRTGPPPRRRPTPQQNRTSLHLPAVAAAANLRDLSLSLHLQVPCQKARYAPRALLHVCRQSVVLPRRFLVALPSLYFAAPRRRSHMGPSRLPSITSPTTAAVRA